MNSANLNRCGRKTNRSQPITARGVIVMMSKSNNSTVIVFQTSTSVQRIKHVSAHFFRTLLPFKTLCLI